MGNLYSARLIYLAFISETKISIDVYSNIKEAGFIMMFPLFLLSIGAVFGGFIFYNLIADNSFWINSIFIKNEINYVDEAHHIEIIYKILPIFLVIFAFLIVFLSYKFIKNISVRLDYNLQGIIIFLK